MKWILILFVTDFVSLIFKELGFNNISSTDIYDKISKLSPVDIIDKSIRELKIKFGIEDVPIENNRSSYM